MKYHIFTLNVPIFSYRCRQVCRISHVFLCSSAFQVPIHRSTTQNFFSECLRRAVIRSVFGLVTSSTSFSPFPLCLISDLFLITRAFIFDYYGSRFSLYPKAYVRSNYFPIVQATFMVDFRKSCTSFHVFSLSFSFTSMILKWFFLKYCSLWLPSLIASFAVYSVSCRAFFSSRTSVLLTNSYVILDTDASIYRIGAVLSQVQNGQERVISYASRTMNKAETNYYVTDKELLAVKYFVEYFKQYLLGQKFRVRTDHQA